MARALGEAPGFGDLARTSAIVARAAADDQHTRRYRVVMPALLRGFEALASFEPLHRNRICRVGKATARGARDGGLAAFLVGLPRDCFQPRNRLALGLVRRAVEAHVESFVELAARQRRRCLSLADLGHGWRASECKR